MTIALAIALPLIALAFVLTVRERDLPEPEPVSPVQHLEDRKHAIYDNLRDLQFEYRVGKLSDEDYQATKQALQRELAGVLAETEATLAKLNLVRVASSKKASATKTKKAVRTVCPSCGAEFPQSLKFCGECGKAIA
jgi:rRNA maturation endonuclease Nob1